MKMKTHITVLSLLALFAGNIVAGPLGTAFTYQGRLDIGTNAASGSFDLTFMLYDALESGSIVGTPQTNLAVAISDGLFTVALDFGSGAFTGGARWLEMGVRSNGSGGAFTQLLPRQELTPTPYAIYAGSAGGLSGTLSASSLTSIGNTNGGAGNFFVGPSGNETLSGAYNTASGNQALSANTSGYLNTANGFYALHDNTSGGNNTANGVYSLMLNTSGSQNTANGVAALYSNTSGHDNTANGFQALCYNTSGNFNTALGENALFANTNGSDNIALGCEAGYNIFGSSNIDIGNPGLATDTNIIRIGSGQTQTFIAGVINGNGGGLTNIPAAAFVAPPPGMVLIPAGSFTMGDTLDGLSDAVPISVTVSAFYMDVNLVSWSQWQSVYYWATNHGYGFVNAGLGKGANHPVQTVDWYDCVKWCNARSEQAGKAPVYYLDAGLTQAYTNGELTVYVNWAASGYRLPTEAEWEKAARGGLSGQRFPWGNVINQNLANYRGDTATYSYDLGPNGYHPIGNYPTTSPGTSPVGSFAANGYGLNDMAGNVFQWCNDWYGTPYGQPTTNNPTGPAGPLSVRVLRGGYWFDFAVFARCAFRYDGFSPDVACYYYGFRCVRGL